MISHRHGNVNGDDSAALTQPTQQRPCVTTIVERAFGARFARFENVAGYLLTQLRRAAAVASLAMEVRQLDEATLVAQDESGELGRATLAPTAPRYYTRSKVFRLLRKGPQPRRANRCSCGRADTGSC